KRYIGLDAAGANRIVRNEPTDGGLDEGGFRRREKNVSGARDAGRHVCGSLLPWNGASKSLRGSAEFAVMHRCRRNPANPHNGATDKQASTDRVDGRRIALKRIAQRRV